VDALRSSSVATGANAKIYQLAGVHSDDDEDDDDDYQDEQHSEEAMQDDEDDEDNAIYRLGSAASHYPVLQATRIMPNAVREEEVEDEEEEEDERMMGGAGAQAAGRRSENEGDSDEWAGNWVLICTNVILVKNTIKIIYVSTNKKINSQ